MVGRTITWINGGLIYCRIYASLGLGKLSTAKSRKEYLHNSKLPEPKAPGLLVWRGNLKQNTSHRNWWIIAICKLCWRSVLIFLSTMHNGPLTRHVKVWVVHAPRMPGTFFPPLRVSDPNMHHGACVTHVPWCIPGSLTRGFLWSLWRGKRSRHSRRNS